MIDIRQSWIETIKHDLEGFADPATSVEVDAHGATMEVAWIHRGAKRSERFNLSPEGDFRWIDGDELRPYRRFLTSSGMADFGQLASALLRRFPAAESYISTKAVPGDGEGVEASDDLLLRQVGDTLANPPEQTRLFFVKADAGAGKTTLLEHLASGHARRFLNGETDFLFLYVSAQGRALSNLRDALAGETQDLRAAFTRDAVPALARNRLLVPIIDGFDELLGAAGYGDAFGSLQQFLQDLSGSGALIVSARSAFYEIEFVARGIPEGSSRFELAPVTLSPWDEVDLFSYLEAKGGDSLVERARAVIVRLPPRDRELLGKPFFASRFPEYVDSRSEAASESGVSLLDYLITSYVQRESGKIVDRDGQPLLSVDGHSRFFQEVADYMWSVEDRRLSEDDLRLVAEVVTGEFNLTGDATAQFVNKITSYAGFSAGPNAGGVRAGRHFTFEHEVYFEYFLSRTLRDGVLKTGRLGQLLDRGILPQEVIEYAVDDEVARALLAQLQDLSGASIREDNRKRNAGSLWAAIGRILGEIGRARVSRAEFVNVSFGDAAWLEVTFRDCTFEGVGLEGAKLNRCVFTDSRFRSILIAPHTRLESEGLTPGEVVMSLYTHEARQWLHSPRDIHARLLQAGAPLPALEAPSTYSRKASQMIATLKRLVNRYRRSNIICLQDDTMRNTFDDSAWPELRALLLAHGIVTEEQRQTSGKPKTFMRPQVDMQSILVWEDVAELPPDQVGALWTALRRA